MKDRKYMWLLLIVVAFILLFLLKQNDPICWLNHSGVQECEADGPIPTYYLITDTSSVISL